MMVHMKARATEIGIPAILWKTITLRVVETSDPVDTKAFSFAFKHIRYRALADYQYPMIYSSYNLLRRGSEALPSEHVFDLYNCISHCK